MKKNLFILAITLCVINISAQTAKNKLGFTIGGGSQKYNGDLGNGFKFKNEAWYGTVTANASYYICNSFDIGLFAATGDYGYCQPEGVAKTVVEVDDRCPGCFGRVGIGNLNSRLTTGGMLLKYKLANGYLLSETAKLKPYVYFGAAANSVTDIMKMQCVQPGKYYSLNAGAGVKYYVNERINIGYNLSFGYFTSDHLDYKMNGRSDMSMQNTLFVGIDLF